MTTHESNVTSDAICEADARPFRMLSIFDSEQGSVDAAAASALVLSELGETIEAARTTWDIRSLDASDTRSMVAKEAARADVIVLALRQNEPSDCLKDWVAQWQKSRQLNSGLLALIADGGSDSANNLESFFYETAVTAKMDFLCRAKPRC